MTCFERLPLLVFALAAIGSLACNGGGDDADPIGEEESTGDGDGDPSGDGDGDPTGDGDGDPSGDGDGDATGDGDPSGDGDGDGDGDASGDGDGDASGDGDGDGDPITYSAAAYFGGLDRVFIDRHDSNTDTCARLTLVSPTNSDLYDVTVPRGWSVEGVSVIAGADCPDLVEPFAYSTAGSGSVEFVSLDMFAYFPCEVDVAATFDLDTDPITMVEFMVEGLPVSGPDC